MTMQGSIVKPLSGRGDDHNMMIERVSDYGASLQTSKDARALVKFLTHQAAATPGAPDTLARLEQDLGGKNTSFLRIKAAVDAMALSTTPAGALRGQLQMFEPLMAYVRRRTILGQINYLPAPPNAKFPVVVTPPEAAWVGEGNPIPATRADIASAQLSDQTKLAAMWAMAWAEWLRVGGDRSLSLLEAHMVKAISDLENATLLDSVGAVEYERPAGLLNGVVPVGAVSSPANVGDEMGELWRSVREGEPSEPAFICSPRGAVYLLTLQSDDGAPLFPNVSPMGGSIWGVKQIASKAAENRLILLDAGALAVSDLGLVVESSNQASIQMTDAPTANGDTVPMFQTNSRVFKIVRHLNWVLADVDAIGFLTLPLGSPN